MKNKLVILGLILSFGIVFTSCDDDDDDDNDTVQTWNTAGGAFYISTAEGVAYADADAAETTLKAAFEAGQNVFADPGITVEGNSINPVATGDYSSKGAFADDPTWADWTITAELFMGGSGNSTTDAGKPIKTISDDGSGTGTVTWSKDTVYLLDKFVFVNDGDVLTIEAGTVVKGKPGTGENASALIVARGGKIMAEGTANEPIIFTAEDDDLTTTTDLTQNDDSKWGGVIVLGKATLNSAAGETPIEGIPTSESRGIYGGNNDTDNSGVFKYVSIRHGGSDIGEGNEINGFTLGGVGSLTVLDNVEVFTNKDDGIEFFGGSAFVTHAVVVACGDDSFDYDEGWHGGGQYWFTYQVEDRGDRCGEHDGGTDPEDGAPYAIPAISNVTYVGNGNKGLITFRDNAGGHYSNSIFMNTAKGIDVELLVDEQDSYKRFSEGDLTVTNSVFYNVAGGVN
ncbi:MAG: hypothetical protein PF489_14760 [Salinivirgaceae bacterium]|nr:hypothetical protein [Salinivirgaceae bacterium]